MPLNRTKCTRLGWMCHYYYGSANWYFDYRCSFRIASMTMRIFSPIVWLINTFCSARHWSVFCCLARPSADRGAQRDGKIAGHNTKLVVNENWHLIFFRLDRRAWDRLSLADSVRRTAVISTGFLLVRSWTRRINHMPMEYLEFGRREGAKFQCRSQAFGR